MTIRNNHHMRKDLDWSVEFLLSNPAAWVRFSAGSGILISILGLGVCVLCLSSVLCWPDILLMADSGRPALGCLFSVLVHNLWLSLQASDSVFGRPTFDGPSLYLPTRQPGFDSRRILISILGLCVCPKFSVLCCLLRWPWHSTDHRFREAYSCVSV